MGCPLVLLNLLPRRALIRVCYVVSNNKFTRMVQCIEVRQVTLPVHQCRSYEQLLASAAEQCGRSLFTLKLFFVSSNGQATLIESDSDLLSLRYIARGSSYSFRVEISKSRAEVEREEQAAAIEEYLEATYEDIAEQALQQ